MATAKIKKSEALVWCPPRQVGERAFVGEPVLIVLGAEGGYQKMSLEALSAIKSVRLIFDARDVSLVDVKLPPLKGSKLRQALPAAVEDALLQDPTQCILAFAKVPANAEGLSRVAAVDRTWFEFVLGAFERRKMKILGAHASSLLLPVQENCLSLICVHEGLALTWPDARNVKQGLGWGASPDADFRAESLRHAFAHVAQGQRNFTQVKGFVEDASWQKAWEKALPALQASDANLKATLEPLPHPGKYPFDFQTLDFLPSRSGTAISRWATETNWKAWRLPMGLAAAALASFLIGLNIHWGKLSQEKVALKQEIDKRFKQSFPGIPVVVDPIAQGQRQVANLRARNGQSGPDDFLPMLAKLGQLAGAGADNVSAVEYRDSQLRVRFQPEKVQNKPQREQLVQGAQRLGLKLVFEDDRQGLAVMSVAR